MERRVSRMVLSAEVLVMDGTHGIGTTATNRSLFLTRTGVGRALQCVGLVGVFFRSPFRISTASRAVFSSHLFPLSSH